MFENVSVRTFPAANRAFVNSMYPSKWTVQYISINRLFTFAFSSITCAQRYKDCIKKYEDQIMHEINQYVDFHSKACDAAFLVRWVTLVVLHIYLIVFHGFSSSLFYSCMAITSLWPPLYSRQDLTNTSNYFFALKPKEKIRLHVLMNTDIIWRHDITYRVIFL